ncbi:GPP34-domain-containing protein [Abortiporus biennis]|nr:GPP34-domain-containing protein [Abortiporus biennis]
MSSQAGLSRRRVPQSSSSNSISSTNPSPSASTIIQHSNSGSISGSHAGSAFEGGHKIAFDPRDLVGEDEESTRIGGKAPKLTIMEEVLLMGLKDKQGYLSFWNDNISYALRGCILIELALRRRIALVKDPNRRQLPVSERILEVIDDRPTGETLLDEALKMMKTTQDGSGTTAGGVPGEKMGVNTWIDLLSGETWNVMKIGFQLKQVRERLAKGLVDKGVLRTEKRNFLLFDMATHPISDIRTKDSLITRVVSLLTSSTSSVPSAALEKEGVQCRVLRAVVLVCSAYAASVLDNAFGRLTYEEREAAFGRCEEILEAFSVWPFGSTSSTSSSSLSSTSPRRREGSRFGMGSNGASAGRDAVIGLVSEVKKETLGGVSLEEDLGFELVAGVLEVLSKLDSLI